MGPESLDPPARLLPVAVVHAADRKIAGRLALAGLLGVGLAAVAIGLLHVLPAGRRLDPMSRTISEYALTPVGWLFDGGVLVLAASSGAVLAALAAARLIRWKSWGAAMVAVWCLALVGLIVFPKRALGDQTDIGSRVHWTWTLVAFFSLPIGAILICRAAVRSGGHGTRWPRWAARLAMVAAGWFGVLAVQTVLSASTAIQAWRAVGLVERALSLTEMAAVAVMALWVLLPSGPVSASSPVVVDASRESHDRSAA